MKSKRRKRSLKRTNRRRSKIERRVSRRAPRTADELFALPDRFRHAWEQTPRVISKMRDDGVSLTRAARELGIRPETVRPLAGVALKKLPNGRYLATARDRLLRVLVIPDERGMREIATRDSGEAAKVSRYYHALQQLLRGDASAFRALRETTIRLADGSTVQLLMDLNALKGLGTAGVLSFETIYARA